MRSGRGPGDLPVAPTGNLRACKATFGDDYEAYRRRTARLIPGMF